MLTIRNIACIVMALATAYGIFRIILRGQSRRR